MVIKKEHVEESKSPWSSVVLNPSEINQITR